MDRRTNGALVYENMETMVPGIFACGNVVHVHDLVDFVTAESQRAGAAAARFVKNRETAKSKRASKIPARCCKYKTAAALTIRCRKASGGTGGKTSGNFLSGQPGVPR